MFAINKSTLVACVAAVAFVGLIGAFEVKRCDDNEQSLQVLYFNVSSCLDKTAELCEMGMDEEIKFEAKFHTAITHPEETVYSTIEMQTEDGKFEKLAAIEACGDLGLECPMKADEIYTFRNHFYMRDSMVAPAYRFGLTDGEGKQIMCVEIPIKVTGGAAPADEEN